MSKKRVHQKKCYLQWSLFLYANCYSSSDVTSIYKKSLLIHHYLLITRSVNKFCFTCRVNPLSYQIYIQFNKRIMVQ